MLNRFKQLINLSLTDEPLQALDHPILGRLAPQDGDSTALVGQVACGAHMVAVRVSADDSELLAALELAAQAAQSILVLDLKSRKLVAESSLKQYNEQWRFGTSLLADGSARAFETPLLTEEEFCEKLQLDTIETSGASCLTLWYSNGGLFLGRSHNVSSFDGLAMGDVHVSTFG
ncbi:MAG TPA: hypothetical protein VGC21_20330 [Telluria sp.]|jgi:hypothetical protein